MSLTNVDNLFDFLEETSLNARRKLLGYYNSGIEPFVGNLSEYIYEYKGEKRKR